jgi:hypothetical protein
MNDKIYIYIYIYILYSINNTIIINHWGLFIYIKHQIPKKLHKKHNLFFLKTFKIMKVNYVMQTCPQLCCNFCIKMSLTLFVERSDQLSQCRELEAYPLQNLYKSNWKKFGCFQSFREPCCHFGFFLKI